MTRDFIEIYDFTILLEESTNKIRSGLLDDLTEPVVGLVKNETRNSAIFRFLITAAFLLQLVTIPLNKKLFFKRSIENAKAFELEQLYGRVEEGKKAIFWS